MVRIALLRAAYGGLGLAFAAIGASVYVPGLLLPGLAVAIVAALLLALSDDHLPKWAGISLLVYFLLTILVFIAATPITIDKGPGYFVNTAPAGVLMEAFSWLAIAAPLMLAASALVATWERERPPRILLFAAAGGFVLVGVLSVLLVPREAVADAARAQGNMMKALFALSAVAGAAGAIWASTRPDEYA